jgi:hypothetical protein
MSFERGFGSRIDTASTAMASRDYAVWALDRFDRLGIEIRCAHDSSQPAKIRHYIGLGQKIVHHAAAPELLIYRAMLKLLLDTSRDEELPWFWRSVCLEHTTVPVARLTTLMKRCNIEGIEALHQSISDVGALLTTHSSKPVQTAPQYAKFFASL